MPSSVPVKDIDTDKITSNNKDNDDNDDDNVGGFNNEVEGGVPCAPHSIFIKKLHILNQTPTYQRNDIEKEEINLLIKKLLNMKSRGEIGGKLCSSGTSWTYKKEEIEKHKIGRMVGFRNSFIVFPEIICTGNTPSLSEVITAIKQTKKHYNRKGSVDHRSANGRARALCLCTL